MIRRILSRGVLLTLIAAGCGGTELDEEGAASLTQAVVGCSGTTCNGKDPIAMGCSADATTVRGPTNIYNGVGGVIGKVELRYSNACKAKWSKVWNNIGGNAGAYLKSGSTGPQISGTLYWGAGAQIYGNMNAAYARACGDIAYAGGNCTLPY